jgi:hypothetical protein
MKCRDEFQLERGLKGRSCSLFRLIQEEKAWYLNKKWKDPVRLVIQLGLG